MSGADFRRSIPVSELSSTYELRDWSLLSAIFYYILENKAWFLTFCIPHFCRCQLLIRPGQPVWEPCSLSLVFSKPTSFWVLREMCPNLLWGWGLLILFLCSFFVGAAFLQLIKPSYFLWLKKLYRPFATSGVQPVFGSVTNPLFPCVLNTLLSSILS